MSDIDRTERDRRDWRLLLIGLAALGVALTAGVVPGIFIVDENNYLVTLVALRQGHVTVANTTGLSPSRELLFFDPAPQSRSVDRTPVTSTAPPLYALIAFPFLWLGWRGLVGLNTLAYIVTIALVFTYTRRYAAERASAWLAAAAFAFCGFSIEYAMGLWPQCLSVALCIGAVILAGDVIETSNSARSALSGLLLGMATGVRYQNAAILAAVALAIFFWSNRRFRCTFVFGLGASLPVILAAFINYERLNSWNPISKGSTYLRVPIVQDSSSSWFDPLVMFWARLADYSYRPHIPAFDFWDTYDVTTGAHLIFGFAVKKALLQSAPWAVLGFAGMCLAWTDRSHVSETRRRQIRLLSLVAFTMLGVFAFSGVRRDDGLSFNQRYLLELVPLLAVVFGWSFDKLRLPMNALSLGGLLGVAMVVVIRPDMSPGVASQAALWAARLYALLKVPLLLAAGLVILWSIVSVRPGVLRVLALWTGMCLGWAMALHLASDLVYAQGLRRYFLEHTKTLERFMPDHSALVALRGMKEPAAPLLLSRDVVIIDPNYDRGADTPVLIEELLMQKRRVFVFTEAMPPDIVRQVTSGLQALPVVGSNGSLVELKSR